MCALKIGLLNGSKAVRVYKFDKKFIFFQYLYAYSIYQLSDYFSCPTTFHNNRFKGKFKNELKTTPQHRFHDLRFVAFPPRGISYLAQIQSYEYNFPREQSFIVIVNPSVNCPALSITAVAVGLQAIRIILPVGYPESWSYAKRKRRKRIQRVKRECDSEERETEIEIKRERGLEKKRARNHHFRLSDFRINLIA